VETPADLGGRPAYELELLVVGRRRLPALDALGGEHVHPLATEARRRPERRQLAPLSPGQAALLLQLSLGSLERLLAQLGGSGRKLEQVFPRRLAQLANE